MHLLYDILDFKPKEIQKAVLFSTNNALVCESQDDANRVAYDLEPGQRFDVSFKMCTLLALESNFKFKCVDKYIGFNFSRR